MLSIIRPFGDGKFVVKADMEVNFSLLIVKFRTADIPLRGPITMNAIHPNCG